ncbi:MAG TPA: cytochrome c biogenesis protein CcsA [Gemmatimonadaceae bacterium]|nr:cytochrome c biogenesis protein CcsA [Gemmatimonadaceae bacterium]
MTAPAAPIPAAPKPGRWPLYGWIVFAFLIVCQIVSIAISPADRDMGHLQKIMYIHFPAALNAFGCFFVVFLYSVLYLYRRRETDDLVAASAAEVGTVFTGLTLALGMIWARPTWGVWWTWDARLTSTLVLFLIFAGYLALRSFVEEAERRAVWSAAVGILGAINVPIVYMSVKWWRTLHQVQSTPGTVDPAYVIGIRLNLTAVLLVAIYFMRRRYEAALTERVAEHRLAAAALGGPQS